MTLPNDVIVKLILADLASPLIVVLFAVGAYLFRPRSRGRAARWLDWLTFAASLLCLLIAAALAWAPPAQEIPPASISILGVVKVDLLIDALSVYFILLVNLVAFAASCAVLTSPPEAERAHLFDGLVNLFHFTMLLVAVVNNLVVLWIAIEATTLVSTLLVSWRGDRAAWEAAWKYLLVTSTGIIFALLGTMFLANAAKDLLNLLPATEQDQVMNFTFLRDHITRLSPDFVRLSFLFVVVGYGTKAGFAPMHTWLPDGHAEAPAPISVLLSGVLLKSALYAILRFATLTNTALGNSQFTSAVLLAVGIFSLVAATPFILNEKNTRFKRVLAYHSLEHMGIITFGVAIGGDLALFGALLHTLNHAVTKSLMFLSFAKVMERFKSIKVFEQADITGVFKRMPVTGGILAVGGLALVGTPPFNIFLSEFVILSGAFKNLKAGATNLPAWLVVMAIVVFMISTTLIFYGLVRHLARLLLMPHEREETRPAVGATAISAPVRLEPRPRELVPLMGLLVLVVALGVSIWQPLARLIQLSVQTLMLR